MMISALKSYNLNFGTKNLSKSFENNPKYGVNKDFERIDLEFECNDNGCQILAYETENFKPIGSEKLYASARSNTIEGKYIHSDIKRKGVGAILHLSSIALLMNSDYNNIKIDSVKSAVLFHKQYGFTPNLTKTGEALEFLEGIIRDTNIIPDNISKKALSMQNKIDRQQSKSFKKEDFDYINSLLDNYYDFFKNNYGNLYNSSISDALPMILEKETVIANKDYFNYLFEDKEMNYSIK